MTLALINKLSSARASLRRHDRFMEIHIARSYRPEKHFINNARYNDKLQAAEKEVTKYLEILEQRKKTIDEDVDRIKDILYFPKEPKTSFLSSYMDKDVVVEKTLNNGYFTTEGASLAEDYAQKIKKDALNVFGRIKKYVKKDIIN